MKSVIHDYNKQNDIAGCGSTFGKFIHQNSAEHYNPSIQDAETQKKLEE